jgi:hypothetical protein
MRSVGNLNCSACIDYLINAVGQGKDFQPQIGGNCDWKFFLRQYAIFKESVFCGYLLPHTYKVIIAHFLPSVKAWCPISL